MINARGVCGAWMG
jgi:hypothetical protein